MSYTHPIWVQVPASRLLWKLNLKENLEHALFVRIIESKTYCSDECKNKNYPSIEEVNVWTIT